MLDKIIALRYNKSCKAETSNRKLERLTKDGIALRYKMFKLIGKLPIQKTLMLQKYPDRAEKGFQ